MLAYLEKKRKLWYVLNIMSISKINFSDHWLERGIDKIYPSREDLDKFLDGGQKLKIYFGIDPTGNTLHIGHGTILLKLKELQKAGHEVIILIGDFTAMIGDPTGKLSSRLKLSSEEIKNNYKNYTNQIGQILDLNNTKFEFNSAWLNKLNFGDIIEIASEFTTAQMLERDMFEERIKKGEPIFIHEFLYPLMQGYDSVAMGVNAEIGASDQTFNMLFGRTMLKKKGQEKFVITTKLLIDSNGKKMGKTEGNMVTLEDTPEDMYGKIMSWSDDLMPLAFEICTSTPVEEVKEILAKNPRDAKMKLAKEIVATFKSVAEADQAEQDFIKKFQQKDIPEIIEEINISSGTLLRDILVDKNIIESKSEFRRLIESGAITTLPLKEKILDADTVITETTILKIGKKTFIKLMV